MENFEYGLPVAWLADFADRLNNALNFKKYDVSLDMLELPSTQDNVRLIETIKNELSDSICE